MSDEPPRPLPPRDLGDRMRSWLAWFGLGRLVTGAVAVAVVVVGSVWLLRAPRPATEAALPLATTTTTSTTLADGAGAVPAVAQSSAHVATSVHVHVAGAVTHAGVHELPAGARVVDAVAAAGGPTPGADLDALNLAAVLADGQRVYVPLEGEVVPVVDAGDQGTASSVPAGPIDLNLATAGELDGLPGVGPTTAAAIVRHREEHGPFVTVDDLLDVRGIGPAKLDAIRELVTT